MNIVYLQYNPYGVLKAYIESNSQILLIFFMTSAVWVTKCPFYNGEIIADFSTFIKTNDQVCLSTLGCKRIFIKQENI